MGVFLAIFASCLAHIMLIGVEMVAGIEIDLLPRILITVPLTLMIEFPMLAIYEGVRK